MSKKGHRSQRADDMIMITRIAVMVWEVVWDIMTEERSPSRSGDRQENHLPRLSVRYGASAEVSCDYT